MEKTITFATQDQANLFEYEIQGQLSDGMWENTRPYDHWKPWCNAKVNVDLTQVGRNFYAQKSNYNLVSPELLSCVGQRMINIVKIGRTFGAEKIEILSYLFDLEGNYCGLPKYSGEYWDNLRAKLTPVIENIDVKATLENVQYGMNALKNDLKAMKEAMRTYLY